MKAQTKKREHCSHAYCGICMNKGKIERDAEELKFLENYPIDDIFGIKKKRISALKARNHIPQPEARLEGEREIKTKVSKSPADSQSEQDERLSSGDYKMNPETDLRKQSGPASETGKEK